MTLALGGSRQVVLYSRVRLGLLAAVEFAPELPPNSPQRRQNPASSTGSRHAILGFLKRRGGDSNPRYRSSSTAPRSELNDNKGNRTAVSPSPG